MRCFSDPLFNISIEMQIPGKNPIFQKLNRLRHHPAIRMVPEDYLLGKNRNRSLNYLLNPSLVAMLFHGTWFLAILLIVFWPQNVKTEYLLTNDIPINFLVIAEALLVGSVYINLICGRGEFRPGYLNPHFLPNEGTWEETRTFLTYGFIKFTIQTVLILLPYLPFLLIAATVSQVSWNGLFKAFSIILSFSLLCRLYGFVTYLQWGTTMTSHYSSRVFLLVFLLCTFYFTPWINPLFLLYDLYQRADEIVTSRLNSYTVYLIFTVLVISLLIQTIHILLRNRPSLEE